MADYSNIYFVTVKTVGKQFTKGWKALRVLKVGTSLNFTVQSKPSEERSSMVFWH